MRFVTGLANPWQSAKSPGGTLEGRGERHLDVLISPAVRRRGQRRGRECFAKWKTENWAAHRQRGGSPEMNLRWSLQLCPAQHLRKYFLLFLPLILLDGCPDSCPLPTWSKSSKLWFWKESHNHCVTIFTQLLLHCTGIVICQFAKFFHTKTFTAK